MSGKVAIFIFLNQCFIRHWFLFVSFLGVENGIVCVQIKYYPIWKVKILRETVFYNAPKKRYNLLLLFYSQDKDKKLLMGTFFKGIQKFPESKNHRMFSQVMQPPHTLYDFKSNDQLWYFHSKFSFRNHHVSHKHHLSLSLFTGDVEHNLLNVLLRQGKRLPSSEQSKFVCHFETSLWCLCSLSFTEVGIVRKPSNPRIGRQKLDTRFLIQFAQELIPKISDWTEEMIAFAKNKEKTGVKGYFYGIAEKDKELFCKCRWRWFRVLVWFWISPTFSGQQVWGECTQVCDSPPLKGRCNLFPDVSHADSTIARKNQVCSHIFLVFTVRVTFCNLTQCLLV